MASFYYNRFSNDNIQSQWIQHLQANEYVNDINHIVSQNRREFEKTIQNASEEQKTAIRLACGTIERGFNEVTRHLIDINFNISELRGEINEMASMLDWKLSLMIEEQRLTNHLLEIVIELQRIPDTQKQRVYYIERGLKYLKNAILEGTDSEFYIKAHDTLTQAENIEDDFITLNKIGQIYLYSKKYLNFSLAKEYFLKSAREALAEDNVDGTKTSNNLRPHGNQPLIYSKTPFKAAAAEAYLYAARALYLQQRLSEAAELAGKAYNLIPELLIAGFEQAKYLAANNQDNEAANLLKTIIEKDRYLLITTLQEKDFEDRPAIFKLIENLLANALFKAKAGVLKCEMIIGPNSKAESIVAEIKSLIFNSDFLSVMKALDLLQDEYQLPFCQYGFFEETIFRTTLTKKQTLVDFIIAENNGTSLLHDLMILCKKKIIANRKKALGAVGAIISLIFLLYQGYNSGGSSSMNSGLLFGILIFFPAFGILIGYQIGISEQPEIRNKN
jgi:tetratricopeptide (TPR) repeat protein